MNEVEPYTLSAANVSTLIGVSVAKVYKLVAAGELHPIDNGTAARPLYSFCERDIAEYQARRLKRRDSAAS